ncbi:MAG: hypothetical protein JNM70_04170 [Anaerolineae bacterium]|nr:hypothetical protein [Anaerolineae bacterium]
MVQRSERQLRIGVSIALLILLMGCGGLFSVRLMFECCGLPTPSLTPSVTFTPSPTPLPYSADMSPTAPMPCAWQWARQDLPDVTSRAVTALTAASVRFTEVRAEAYGENCVYMNANQAQTGYFAAMTTDFYLTVPVESIQATDALAEVVLRSYYALVNLTDLPAKVGYLDITFTGQDGTAVVRTMFDRIVRALQNGLSGAALLEGIGGVVIR